MSMEELFGSPARNEADSARRLGRLWSTVDHVHGRDEDAARPQDQRHARQQDALQDLHVQPGRRPRAARKGQQALPD